MFFDQVAHLQSASNCAAEHFYERYDQADTIPKAVMRLARPAPQRHRLKARRTKNCALAVFVAQEQMECPGKPFCALVRVWDDIAPPRFILESARQRLRYLAIIIRRQQLGRWQRIRPWLASKSADCARAFRLRQIARWQVRGPPGERQVRQYRP